MGRWSLGKYKGGSNKKMQRNQKCKYCGKTYAMDWAKENHETLCKQRD